ncbi:MAG: hypothetical protein EOM77_03670 [Bacteroidia bacterium]|nr:hypothetical protein [Bacteroidia bacterium]
MKAFMAACTSNDDTVTLEIKNLNGNTSDTVTIPSFQQIQNTLIRMERNYDTLTNVVDGSGSMVGTDGSLRKLLIAKFPQEAKYIDQLNNVSSFNFKENHFFESMLNPLLYVNFDVSKKLPIATERVRVRRYILTVDNDVKMTWWNTIANRKDLEIENFLRQCTSNNVYWTLDDELVDMPAYTKRYTGTFTITGSYCDDNGLVPNMWMLNTTNYVDNEVALRNSKTLKVGDSVYVRNDDALSQDTRYQIDEILDGNIVKLTCLEGNDPIEIGTDLCIYSPQDTGITASLKIEVPIAFNEYTVVFVKAIDPDSNIEAAEWSHGVSFYTNNLKIKLEGNTEATLQDWYRDHVINFGNVMMQYADNSFPTFKQGIKTEAPVLNASNFGIYMLNSHLFNDETTNKIIEANREKTQAKLDLNTVLDNIESTEKQLSRYAMGSSDYIEIQQTLNNYIESRNSILAKLNGSINTLNEIYESTGTADSKRKYVIRGWWLIPTEPVSAETGVQKIIKFKIRYKYLSGNGSEEDQDASIVVKGSTNGTANVRYSTYCFTDTVLRKRDINASGAWVWKDISSGNGVDPEINQCQIAISRGEKVRIWVKTITEAGFPNTCVESDWSEPIDIEFPANSNDNVYSILDANYADKSYNRMVQTLNAMSVFDHVDNSFTDTANVRYLHTASKIASGFINSNNAQFSVYDVLNMLKTDVNTISAELKTYMENGNYGFSFKIDNKTTKLTKDDTNRIILKPYIEENVGANGAGTFITKNATLYMNPTSGLTVRVLPRIIGDYDKMVRASSRDFRDTPNGKFYGYENWDCSEDTDYNMYCKYDRVPVKMYGSDLMSA